MVIVPLGKLSFAFFRGNVRFWRGREGSRPIGACSFKLTLSFFLSFLFFSLCFRSNLFSFPLTLLFLSRCEKSPVFRSLYRARQRPLYSVCRDQCFTVLPLNRLCLVWVCLPIVQNPCQTEADPFCPSVRRRLILSFCAPRPFLPRC